jgi:pilus assembly protein CpaC
VFANDSPLSPWLLVVLLSVLSPRSVSADTVENNVIELTKGEQRVVPSHDVRSYSEGVPGVADVRLTREGTEFVVVGLRAGETSLLLLLRDGSEVYYRIVVSDPDAQVPVAVTDTAQQRVPQRENIRLDFYFVELTQTYGHQLGVSWPASVGGGTLSASFDVLAGGFDSATAVVATQVLPRLDIAQSEGWAKVMRRAAVITANGTEAKFAGGGEVNVAVTGGFGGTLKQIEFGSVIGVLPRFDRESGRIELAIHANVSDLTPGTGTGIPGRSVSTLETVVNLELSQSLVLAGLSSRAESSERSGLPWLSQIPIIGALFGSQRALSRETETLIFIVPTVVEAVDPRAREDMYEALALYERYDGDLAPIRTLRTRALPERVSP